jgi:hypothetical protein
MGCTRLPTPFTALHVHQGSEVVEGVQVGIQVSDVVGDGGQGGVQLLQPLLKHGNDGCDKGKGEGTPQRNHFVRTTGSSSRDEEEEGGGHCVQSKAGSSVATMGSVMILQKLVPPTPPPLGTLAHMITRTSKCAHGNQPHLQALLMTRAATPTQ